LFFKTRGQPAHLVEEKQLFWRKHRQLLIALYRPNRTRLRKYAGFGQIGCEQAISRARIVSRPNPAFLKRPENLGYRPQPPDRQELAAFLAANKVDIHAINIAVPPEYMAAYAQLTAPVVDAEVKSIPSD
jgi:hypothetical protein